MNSNEPLSRDELIEKVAGPIDDEYDDYWPRYNAAGVCVSSGLAAVADDAVLRAVADDLDAMYCDAGVSVREENNGYMYGEDIAYLEGVEAAEAKACGVTGLDPCPWHPDGDNHPTSAP